jgi:hypothetical protein
MSLESEGKGDQGRGLRVVRWCRAGVVTHTCEAVQSLVVDRACLRHEPAFTYSCVPISVEIVFHSLTRIIESLLDLNKKVVSYQGRQNKFF